MIHLMKIYKSYTKQVKWGNLKSFYTVSNKLIKHDIEEFDFTIAHGTSLAF